MACGELRQLCEERAWGGGGVGIVGVVDPDEGSALEHLRVNSRQIREKTVLLQQREADDLRAGELGAAFVNGVRRVRDSTVSLPRGTSAKTCAKLKIASFEPSVGMSSRSGSSATPKRRATQPAIATRSSGKPSAFG